MEQKQEVHSSALKLLREYNAPFWSPSCSSNVLLATRLRSLTRPSCREKGRLQVRRPCESGRCRASPSPRAAGGGAGSWLGRPWPASKFLFPEGSGAGISTPSASADPLLAGAGTAASAVVGCSRERARAASSALADIAAGSRCYPRDVFAAARPLLLARKEERCVGARSRSTSVHSNNSLCSEIGRLANPPS